MPSQGHVSIEATSAKVGDSLLRTEPIWVFIAISFVYLSIIFHWASFLPWLWLGIAFVPFPLRQIRLGYLSQRTPFDIPLAILLAGVIVGLSVSEHFAISIGGLQSFLAMSALYYSFINYPHPARLVKWGLGAAALGMVIAAIFALSGAFEPAVPHGLAIGLVIAAAIAAGIAIFGRRVLSRVVNGVLCSSLLGGAIFFLYQSGALQRFFTFQTTDGRMSFWTYALGFMHGHAFFSGVGLGCWPLVSGTFPSHPWELHVHNAYLELYVNAGVIGVIALICFVVVGAKLGSDIIHSLKKHPYYGLGIGVLLAIVAVALASVFESASFGLPVVIGDAYYYVLSPIPLLLAALLVIAHQLLKQPEAPG